MSALQDPTFAQDRSSDFVVDGWLEGDVSTDGRVVIGPHGHLVGCVCAAELIVAGRMEGSVHSGRVHVRGRGRIDGDVEYGHLRVDQGGAVEAQLVRLPPEWLRVPAPSTSLVDDEPWHAEPVAERPGVQVVRDDGASIAVASSARSRWPVTVVELRRHAVSMTRGAMLAAAAAMVCGLSVVPTSEPQAASLTMTDGVRIEPRKNSLDWRWVRTPWLSAEALKAANPPSVLDQKDYRWTATGDMSLRRLAYYWGIPREQLEALNPGVDPEQILPEGTPVCVYRKAAAEPAVSVGAPNLGFLAKGMPMPEGSAWEMPRLRRRAFGARQTVETLVKVFEAYGRFFRDAPLPELGDISAFGGRELRPHRSHQSGRDVDIYFVRAPDPERPEIKRFDAEKNWFLIRKLIDSGKVQEIYVDQRIQSTLREAARAELSEEDVRRYFASISHESGHVNHMHVRFACSAENGLCRSHSIPDLWASSEEPEEGEEIEAVVPERMAQTTPAVVAPPAAEPSTM